MTARRLKWVIACLCVVIAVGVILTFQLNQNSGISADMTPTPVTPLNIQFTGINNLHIVGLYYPAPQRPAPTVLLLNFKTTWSAWAPVWSARGFNVIAIDLLTYGPHQISPELAREDIQNIVLVIEQLQENPDMKAHEVALVGGSLIGGYAIVACAKSPDCQTAVLLSATDYKDDLDDPIETLGNRPLLIVQSKNEGTITATGLDYAQRAQGEHQLIAYAGGVHAVELIRQHSELVGIIGDWFVKYLGDGD